MKNTVKPILSVLLATLLTLSLAACRPQSGDPWANALYTEDTSFGDGQTSVQVEVRADDRSVTFTLHTDAATLGDALCEYALIDGEEGEYGLYVKSVNGITADYDVDQHYWALCRDGEMLPFGVDGAQIGDGEHYELVYSK